MAVTSHVQDGAVDPAIRRQGHGRDSVAAFSKLTHDVDGEFRIISDPPMIVPIEELLRGDEATDIEHISEDHLRLYRNSLPGDRRHLVDRFRYAYVARKVVGVGSVGTRDWIVLLLGRDGDDPLFLQVKEASASVLAPYMAPSEYDNQGQRIVEGRRLMQAASDIFLGGSAPRASTMVSPETSLSASSGTGRSTQTSSTCRRSDCLLRPSVRLDACPSPRSLRRPHCHRGLSRFERHVCHRHR